MRVRPEALGLLETARYPDITPAIDPRQLRII